MDEGCGWLARAVDAIVLDIMRPERNGLSVCSSLREAGIWSPILMLTAREAESDEVHALDSGADDYLTKRSSHAVLVARLRATSAGARASVPPPRGWRPAARPRRAGAPAGGERRSS